MSRYKQTMKRCLAVVSTAAVLSGCASNTKPFVDPAQTSRLVVTTPREQKPDPTEISKENIEYDKCNALLTTRAVGDNGDALVKELGVRLKIANTCTVPTLIGALKDGTELMRARAAGALGNIAEDSAVPALTVALKDNGDDVQMAASCALQEIAFINEIKDDATILALIEAFNSRKGGQCLAEALIEIGKPAVPSLIERLKSGIQDANLKDMYVTILASISSYAGLDDAQLKTIIIKLGSQNEWEEKISSAKGWRPHITWMHIRNLPFLVKSLDDPLKGITACESIFAWHPLDEIFRALEHEDKEIRKSALIILKKGVENANAISCSPGGFVLLKDPDSSLHQIFHLPQKIVTAPPDDFLRAIKSITKIMKNPNEDKDTLDIAADVWAKISENNPPKAYLINGP